MGYIGNTPAEKYTSLSKQDLAGDGTAGPYTLDYAVGGNAELEIFVNNVRQEPSSAYSVAGNQLTMTGNVASTDDFYVVFQGKAVGTISPPDGSVTSAKLDANIAVAGDLTVDTDTLYVDSANNKVGIGTTTPSTLLHLSSTSPRITLTDTSTGADHRINADSSAGNLAFDIDVNSVTTNPSAVFNIKGSEAMRINSNGVVMVSRTSAYADGAIGLATFQCGGVAGSRAGIACIQNSTAGVAAIGFVNPNGTVGSITTSGTSTSYLTSSDHRLKENVTDITGATDRLKQLNPVRFNFIADADTTVDGFLAHEVADIVPEAISGEKDAVDDDGNAVYQSIDQSKLVPLLVATIREQQSAIEALTARVTALEAE